MGFAFSDIILFATLLLNGGAVLNFKLRSPLQANIDNPAGCETVSSRLVDFLYSLRYFRVLILLWNVLVVFAMFVFFS
jgi:hypothetical protein